MQPVIINRSYISLFAFVLLFTVLWLVIFPWHTHWIWGVILYLLIVSILFFVMFLLKKTPAIIMDEQQITIRLPGGGQILWSEIRSTTLKRPVRAGTVLEIELMNGSKRVVGLSSLDMPPTKIHEIIRSRLKHM